MYPEAWDSVSSPMNTTTQDAQLNTDTDSATETTPAQNVSLAQLAQQFATDPEETAPGGAAAASDPVESSPNPAPDTGHEHDQGEGTEATPPPQPAGEEATEAPAETEAAPEPRAVREFETPKFQARVDELTAKVKALEAKLGTPPTAAPAEPTEVMLPPAQEGAIPMVFRDERLDQIGRAMQNAEAMVRLVEENPDGLEIPGAEGASPQTYTPEQLARMRSRAQADLTRLTIQRELRLSELAQRRQEETRRQVEVAAARYPWIRDAKSPKYQEAMRIVKANPRLQLEPNAVLLVAGAVEAAMGGRQPAKPSTTRPTPVVARPGGVSARPASQLEALRAELKQAEVVAAQEGTKDSLSKVLRLRREVQLASRQTG